MEIKERRQMFPEAELVFQPELKGHGLRNWSICTVVPGASGFVELKGEKGKAVWGFTVIPEHRRISGKHLPD